MNWNLIGVSMGAIHALPLAMKVAETRRDFEEINRVASSLLTVLRGIEQNADLVPRLREEAQEHAEALRIIQRQSCDAAEVRR